MSSDEVTTTEVVRTIRASSLPRILSCPASLRQPRTRIEPCREESALGTAVHAVMDDIVKGSLDAVPDLDPYVKRYDVDADELRFLSWRGMDIWKELRSVLDPQSIESERELMQDINSEFRLVGHVDVSAFTAIQKNGRISPPTLVVIDWKSGYVEREYFSQLMGYAWLAYWNHDHYEEVISQPYLIKIVTVWLRAGVWDNEDITIEELYAFERRLTEVISTEEEIYSPDDAHCMYCPRSMECPARAMMVQSAIRNLWPAEYEAKSITDRDKLGVLYSQAKSLKRVLEEYDSAVKESIRRDGPIPLPGGGVISLQECSRQTIYYTDAAEEAIAPYLGAAPADVVAALGNEALTINKDSLLSAVAKKAERGQKAEAKRAVLADLEAAGCVRTTRFDKLTPLTAKQLEKEPRND